MDVSVIIVSWNTRELLRNCLTSISEQTRNTEFEVTVVDNDSDDDSAAMVGANFPQVTLIENSQNRGFAAANNQAIATAKGRYVLLLNSDTLLLDCAIDKAVAFAESHPEADVIGPRVLNPDRTLQPTCFMFPSILNMFLSATYLYKVFPLNRFFGRERMTWWDRNNIRQVDVVTGCFMLIRKEAIERVGLLDERFFMYAEETDFCYRIKQNSGNIFFVPGAQIVHFGGASSTQIKPEMTLQLRAAILLFFKKHRSGLSYILACLLINLFFSLRVMYWLMKAAFSRNSRTSDLQTATTYIVGAFKALFGWQALSFRK